MTIESIITGPSLTSVTIDGVIDTDTKDAVFETALAAANETRDRLHGWTVAVFSDGVAVVDMLTA